MRTLRVEVYSILCYQVFSEELCFISSTGLEDNCVLVKTVVMALMTFAFECLE